MIRTFVLSIASLLLTPSIALAQGAPPAPPGTGTSPPSSYPPPAPLLPSTGPAPAPLPSSAAPEIAPPPPPSEAAPPPPSTAAWPAAAPPAPPPAPPAGQGGSPIEYMSLSLMRDKGIISQAEFEGAVKALSESVGLKAPQEGNFVLNKWALTLYGFVEADMIADTTRSFLDTAGASQVQRSGNQPGDQGRLTMGIRNSRFGFRIKAPEVGNAVRTSATMEFDFLGLPSALIAPSATGNGSGLASTTNEGGLYASNELLRVRHLNLKVETPVLDFLFGQYWSLFGWQPLYNPNTVEIQGIPGELFLRTPQLRISKTVKAHPVTLEVAVAAQRPVQRDSAVPDGHGAIRFAVDSWTGMQTIGAAGTQISPLSVAVSGLVRQVRVDAVGTSPIHSTSNLVLSAIAVDGFFPILPGTKEKKDNSLSAHGEFTTGYGDADQFTGLTGGVGAPTVGSSTAVADIDSGIVQFDSTGALHGIQWTTYNIGGQYYFPGLDGRMWIAGDYSHIESNNIQNYGSPAKLTKAEDWFDVNLFGDPTPAVRLGLEYANFNTQYVDGQHAINHRVQFSGFFIF